MWLENISSLDLSMLIPTWIWMYRGQSPLMDLIREPEPSLPEERPASSILLRRIRVSLLPLHFLTGMRRQMERQIAIMHSTLHFRTGMRKSAKNLARLSPAEFILLNYIRPTMPW